MSEVEQYGDRDLMALDEAGGHYIRHVDHMTSEKLHGKSDIAAELGWRDMQIAALKAERDALAAENLSLLNMVSNWPKEQCPTTGNVTDVQPADFIPATDAYANQLRAEGVEMFAKHFNCADISDDILEFAANLRKENGNG